ncbi:MAG: XRE family transcriptional regulator [Anaerolineales bacterium]|nr:XRE family transcriptional regulator [Anaerolineales bacterium]
MQKEAPSINVGDRLRELREERKFTMRGLATKSGLSANALSMIERNKTSPSVSTLYKLADALNVEIAAFFGAPQERQQVVLMKADERPRVSFTRGLWEDLGGANFAGRVQPFLLTLESGGGSGPAPMLHSGHEFVYCLRGRLEYLLFAAKLRHRWRNPGNTVVNALILLSDFSETERGLDVHQTSAEE